MNYKAKRNTVNLPVTAIIINYYLCNPSVALKTNHYYRITLSASMSHGMEKHQDMSEPASAAANQLHDQAVAVDQTDGGYQATDNSEPAAAAGLKRKRDGDLRKEQEAGIEEYKNRAQEIGMPNNMVKDHTVLRFVHCGEEGLQVGRNSLYGRGERVSPLPIPLKILTLTAWPSSHQREKEIKKLYVWDLQQDLPLITIPMSVAAVVCAALLDPSHSRLAVYWYQREEFGDGSSCPNEGYRSRLQMWDLSNQKILCSLDEFADSVLAFDNVGARFVTMNSIVRDTISGCVLSRRILKPPPDHGISYQACFSDDDKIVISSVDNCVVMWDPCTGESLLRFERPHEPYYRGYSQRIVIQGKLCLVADERYDENQGDSHIAVFDYETGEKTWATARRGVNIQATCLWNAVDSDDIFVAVAETRELTIWDATRDVIAATIKASHGQISDIRCLNHGSSSASLLSFVEGHHRVRFFDCSTWKEYANIELDGHYVGQIVRTAAPAPHAVLL
jgi:hypothetical protein